ncbi:MAG: hypothetical protein NC043_05645 [Muribaculaceae bacterium]|nr:hypothetical protein [Muribaculaceae bacterium]
MTYTTATYRTPAYICLHTEAQHLITPLCVCAFIALAIPGALAITYDDLRWVIVALMVLLIIIPGALFTLYMSRMLTPCNTRALLPHQVTITPWQMLTVTYISDDEHPRTPAPESHPWSAIASASRRYNGVLLKFKDYDGWLHIPYDACPPDMDTDKIFPYTYPE